MIVLSFEKKTEQLNSEFWLRIGQSEHGLDTCTEEEVPRRDFSIAWILTQPRLFSTFEQFKAILEENQVDPARQDNVLFPSGFAGYIYHVGSSHDMHSIVQSGLILVGKDVKRGRQTVFFTTVNPMFAHPHKQRAYDVTKPRVAVYQQNWKKHQNTLCWANLRVAQKKGLTFDQTRSNAILLVNTLPAACILKVVALSSGDELCNKTGLGRKTKRYFKHGRETIWRQF